MPNYSTYKRYITKRPVDGIPLERLEDFLFAAITLIDLVERDGGSDNRTTYLKRAMYRLSPDVGIALQMLREARKRLERLEGDDSFNSHLVYHSQFQPERLRFASRCRELSRQLISERHFVPLVLLTEERTGEGSRGNIRDQYDDLGEAVDDASSPLLVLLGDPGAGKTTLMKRLYGALLWRASARENEPIPLIMTLGSGRARKSKDPETLVSETWEITYGQRLATFTEISKLGKVFLLLDGLNESSDATTATAWKTFLEGFLDVYGNRAIVSCRSFDYALPMSSELRYVPHLRIAPLGPVGIEKYLSIAISGGGKDVLARILGDSALMTLYGSPYFLSVLSEDANSMQAVQLGKAELLRRLVWRLLHREYARDPSAFDDPLFTQSDRSRIANSPGFNKKTRLPDEGRFTQFLSDLAFSMGSRTSIDVRDAEEIAALPQIEAKKCVKTACATAIVSLDFQEWALSFKHQLLQEFFAGHLIARGKKEEDMWRLRWRAEELPKIEIETLQERLPSLPTTGREEATLVAAAITQNPEELVTLVCDQNPLLAARCVNEVKVSAALQEKIQGLLLSIEHNAEADVRARLAAGLLITDLTLLGYQHRTTPIPHLVPPTVRIEDGTYTVGAPTGSASGLKGHATQLVLDTGKVRLQGFEMAAYHVTNAEFALFLAAGGYQDRDWWPEGRARIWLERDGYFEDLLWQLEVDIDTDRSWGADYIESQIGHRWTLPQGRLKIEMLSWTTEEKRAWLSAQADSTGSPRFPAYWFNPEYNAPSQPVVGVSWYEASAYCLWLSSLIGDTFRLPTEQEYEAVARGLAGNKAPYGNAVEPSRSNIRSSHIWKPTPVGFYPNGQFMGVHDLIGNVWTWTSSFDPPDSTDDRIRRVTRGGSYDTSPEYAAAYYRDSNHPGNRNRYDGFRLVRGTSR